MFDYLRSFKSYFIQSIYWTNLLKNKKFRLNRIESDIVRLSHSIEKGMCIRYPNLGYGKSKINSIFNLMNDACNIDPNFYNNEIFYMACDTINEYLKYMKNRNYVDDDILEYKNKMIELSKYFKSNNLKYGGIKQINIEKLKFNEDEIKKLFMTRHSFRIFSNEEINKKKLTEALSLAYNCPSACNRQATRTYIINHKKINSNFKKWLSGTGGFDSEIKDYILVCSKLSSYMIQEFQQYEISSGIFVGYLTLALHSFGIGSCIIQRDVLKTRTWTKIQDELCIPKDEQIICIIGCGIPEKNCVVPFSYKFKLNKLNKFLK